MNTNCYIAALQQKFRDVTIRWPDLSVHINEVSVTFQSLVIALCDSDTIRFQEAFDQASRAHSRMLWSYLDDASAYRRLLDQGRAHLLEEGRSYFFDQCRDFLTTLHRARRMGLPQSARISQDMPKGNVLMYRGITFLKGLEIADDGRITTWSQRNHSTNESALRSDASSISVVGADGTPTSKVMFVVRNSEDSLLIAPYCGDPLVLHCLVCGPSAALLRQARDTIMDQDMARLPKQSPITPDGKDDYFAVHHDYRRRGGRRFHPPTLLAIAANRYWKFTRPLRIADIVRKLPKVSPSYKMGFDFQALCREQFDLRSSISLGGYVSLYHLHLPQRDEDVFVLEGYGQIFMIGQDFTFGAQDRFKERLATYVPHLAKNEKNVCETRVFYQVARALFIGAPAARQAQGLTLGYGNWRVGDCSFALTAIRQMADLGYEVEVLDQDSELLGFDAETAAEKPHLRALFGEAAMSRIRFNADYLDGLGHLMSASLGLAPSERFAFQGRGRTYGNLWQKIMFPEFDGRRRDLVLGWPTERRDLSRPFGIFFTLDLEKRRWLEQEEFLDKLIEWADGQSVPITIFLNGMTGYRHAHRLNAATLKTFIHEDSIVSEFEARVITRYRNVTFSSMAKLTLDEKCQIVHEKVDYCIGPLGSGTVVPSVLYSKPGLIYSSNAMYGISRDKYKNIELLIGPYSELVPLTWSRDVDARDHKIFPEAEMTNYAIQPQRVLDLAIPQLEFHIRKYN